MIDGHTYNNANIKKYLNNCMIYTTIYGIMKNYKGVDIVASDSKKNIVLRVDQNFHQQVKLYVTMNNTTLQEYIVGLIRKDMEQHKKEE